MLSGVSLSKAIIIQLTHDIVPSKSTNYRAKYFSGQRECEVVIK